MSPQGPQSTDRKLLSEFPPVSYDDWRKVVQAELKDAPFDKKMFASTPEGIQLKPIYRREDVAGLPHVNSFPGFAPFVGVRAPRATFNSPGTSLRKLVFPARGNLIMPLAIRLGAG